MTRTCDCPHGFPLCCCAEGSTGVTLLLASRHASAIAGWPTRHLDPDAVRAHLERMKTARRARKPRIPLGTRPPAAPPPPPDCVPCRQKGATPPSDEDVLTVSNP
jgi:hypothetical protein